MAEQTESRVGDQIPESRFTSKFGLSAVWIIPAVALLIGAWLAFNAWSESGPTITIRFNSAEGLQAGKTDIKYKNVVIGQINDIELDKGLGSVIVKADVVRSASRFLTDHTRFWVVKARIAASGVSGLETLFSGAYIGVDPSTEGKQTRQFIGLEKPPVISEKEAGSYFLLHADDLSSLERDDPVYYKKINVGQVVDYQLNADGKSVTIEIFVQAPYHRWVNKKTKFWDVSGVSVDLSAKGLKVNTESLVSMLIGGIAFDTKGDPSGENPAESRTEFTLYSSREYAFEKRFRLGSEYLLYFSESVRGLEINAPVEFRGIQLGRVVDIRLSFDPASKQIKIPVKIFVEDERLVSQNRSSTELQEQQKQILDHFVNKGMRARLKAASLLTGRLFIDIDFFKDAKPFQIDWNQKIPVFPTVESPLNEISKDLQTVVKNTNATLVQIRDLSYRLNHELAPEVSDTLQQTRKSLKTIDETLQNDSFLQQDLQSALKEIARSARSIRMLADYLEKHPESLIEGKPGGPL